MNKNLPCIFDMHTHIFNEIILQEYLSHNQGVARSISIQYWTGHTAPRYSVEALLEFAKKAGTIDVVPAVNFFFPLKEQLALLESLVGRIVGLKLYPGYQPFFPDSDFGKAVAQFCVKHNLPLIIHSGHTSNRGAADVRYTHPNYIGSLARQVPECRIVIAHFGFPYFMETAMVMSNNDNVYTDISGTIDDVSEAAAQRLMARYVDDIRRTLDYFPMIVERIMFGTDFGGHHTPLNKVEEYVTVVQSLFSREQQLLVFAKTAEKLFNVVA